MLTTASVGRAVEERGFDSLFVPEHSPIPAGVEVWLREYSRLFDPFLALTAATVVTERFGVRSLSMRKADHW